MYECQIILPRNYYSTTLRIPNFNALKKKKKSKRKNSRDLNSPFTSDTWTHEILTLYLLSLWRNCYVPITWGLMIKHCPCWTWNYFIAHQVNHWWEKLNFRRAELDKKMTSWPWKSWSCYPACLAMCVLVQWCGKTIYYWDTCLK